MIFIRIKPFPIFHLFLLLHLLLTTFKPAFQRSVSSSATSIHTAISSEIAFLVGVNAGSIHNLCYSTRFFLLFFFRPLFFQRYSFHIFQHRNSIQTSKRAAQLGHDALLLFSFITFIFSELLTIIHQKFSIEMNGRNVQNYKHFQAFSTVHCSFMLSPRNSIQTVKCSTYSIDSGYYSTFKSSNCTFWNI